MDILRMFYQDKDLVITASRSPKPISQVAENITVISAQDIEAINAHTLTDVLLHVTGVQVDVRGGPGVATAALIQGSDTRHVQVMIDGVSLNNLSDIRADIGSIPVQHIERIEIIKGPGSSVWGSGLGGVVNIITKSPNPDRRFGGSFSASGGERGSGDFRLDSSGTIGNLGYYLYGGGLTSDGLTPGTPVDAGALYTKLRWTPASDTRLQLSFGYDKTNRGDGQDPVQDFTARINFENLFLSANLSHDFSDDLNLDVSMRLAKKRFNFLVTQMSTGDIFVRNEFDDMNLGGSGKLVWQKDMHKLLVGFDADHGRLKSESILNGREYLDRMAVFANDTITIGDFSITPGIRYDYTSTNDDFFSPSLGITWTPLEQTILRAFVARGFNIPPLAFTFLSPGGNPDLKVEEVNSYQIGLESALIPHLWLKTTAFIHDVRDVIPSVPPLVNLNDQWRQGFEVELKSASVYHLNLLAGYTFIDARDKETHQRVPNVPTHTYDVGLDYNDNGSLRGSLRGHYIWWNADASSEGKYNGFIWDLNLAKRLVERESRSMDVFFTAHNLFNGAQYSTGPLVNPGRWFEGGVRISF
jgi:vitamin B12 transporter